MGGNMINQRMFKQYLFNSGLTALEHLNQLQQNIYAILKFANMQSIPNTLLDCAKNQLNGEE